MLQEYLLASPLSPAIAKSQQEYLVDDLLILVLANEDSSLRCHCTLREWWAHATQNRAANSRCAEPAKILAFLPPLELFPARYASRLGPLYAALRCASLPGGSDAQRQRECLHALASERDAQLG